MTPGQGVLLICAVLYVLLAVVLIWMLCAGTSPIGYRPRKRPKDGP